MNIRVIIRLIIVVNSNVLEISLKAFAFVSWKLLLLDLILWNLLRLFIHFLKLLGLQDYLMGNLVKLFSKLKIFLIKMYN